jgi:hypothetical protein
MIWRNVELEIAEPPEQVEILLFRRDCSGSD